MRVKFSKLNKNTVFTIKMTPKVVCLPDQRVEFRDKVTHKLDKTF